MGREVGSSHRDRRRGAPGGERLPLAVGVRSLVAAGDHLRALPAAQIRQVAERGPRGHQASSCNQSGQPGTLDGCAFRFDRRRFETGRLLQQPTLGEIEAVLQLEDPRLQSAAGKVELVADLIEGRLVPSG